MPKPSFGGSQPDYRNNTGNEKLSRINRDLSSLQQEIRVDFDQRISDLTSLMSKFKALMASDIRSLSTAKGSKSHAAPNDIPTLTNRIDDASLADSQILNSADGSSVADGNANIKQEDSVKPNLSHLSVLRETARFEAGLYQLNCQLYRFRLELDQELEYREEPLHVHFNEQSDLSSVLEQISNKRQQEQKS